MSLTGSIQTQSITSSNNTLEKIKNLIKQKNFSELRNIIANCKETSIATEVYNEIFCKMLPGCWLSFLRNKHLHYVLGQRELISIMNAAACHEMTNETKKKNFHLVMVTIASNTEWCRMLSYRFFLDYIVNSKPLLEHVIFDVEFMTHLDYTHMAMLFNLISDPENQKILLEYLDEILDSRSIQYNWALESIQYMFIHCFDVHKKIVELECKTIITKLKEAFLHNKPFALSVLKNPRFYQFFGLEPEQAFRHPLLDNNGYKEVIAHLQKVDIMLACQYTFLHIEILKQECETIREFLATNPPEGMITLSFNERGGQISSEQPQSQLSSVKPDKTTITRLH